MKKILSILLILAMVLNGCTQKENKISRATLQKHTEYITQTVGIRVVGTPKEKEVADYVFNALESYGFSLKNKTLVRQAFSALGNDSENIIAIKKGSSDKIIMVVAHHDSVETSVGAKDNAIGSAALLEIARVLFDEGSVGAEVRFISLGSEENGYHGSEYYVSTLSEKEKQNTLAVYNLDISAASSQDGFVPVCTTLGGRTETGYTEGNGFEPAQNAVSRSIEQAFFNLGFFTEKDEGIKYKKAYHYGESDHISFHNSGIDSANVCWRKIEGDRASLPPEYHKMTDTADNIDYSTTEITARAVVEAIKIIDSE